VQTSLNKADSSTQGGYIKPGTGIPVTDLTSSVQTSLGKADSGYQKPGSGIPVTDLTTAVQTSLGKADSATQGGYVKPGTGIPSTDLAAAVQTSLTNAAAAYQKPGAGIPTTDLTAAAQANLAAAAAAAVYVFYTGTSWPARPATTGICNYMATNFNPTSVPNPTDAVANDLLWVKAS
jgi:hypothetical protein